MNEEKEERGRIGGEEWTNRRPALTTAIFNANYGQSGRFNEWYSNPWTVIGPIGFERFNTHAEAVAWAFKKVGVWK